MGWRRYRDKARDVARGAAQSVMDVMGAFDPGTAVLNEGLYALGLPAGQAGDGSDGSMINSLQWARNKAAAGGGGGGGGGGGADIPTAASSMEQYVAAFLEQNPKIAEYLWQQTQKYTPLYSNLMRGEATLDREADMADVSRMAGGLQGIRESAELPEVTAIRKMLLEQVSGDLAMGEKLTPAQELESLNAIRSAQFARGGGMGQGSVNREAVQRSIAGLKLKQQRQGQASSVLGQEYANSPNPWSTILRPATSSLVGADQTAAGLQEPSLGLQASEAASLRSAAAQNESLDLQRKQLTAMVKSSDMAAQLALANPDLHLTPADRAEIESRLFN